MKEAHVPPYQHARIEAGGRDRLGHESQAGARADHRLQGLGFPTARSRRFDAPSPSELDWHVPGEQRAARGVPTHHSLAGPAAPDILNLRDGRPAAQRELVGETATRPPVPTSDDEGRLQFTFPDTKPIPARH